MVCVLATGWRCETWSHAARKTVILCTALKLAMQLTDVPDLSGFTQLRYIWLNNNRIKHIHGPLFHCCLAELYLQNNEITSIAGALRHLSCLRVLLLHNNHLLNLEETVAELRTMQHLQTLNLFLNPLTQDPLYRKYMVHHLPFVQLLDRKEVRQEERKRAFKLFCPERQTILDTLAFGRRALKEKKMTQDTQRGLWSSKAKRIKWPFDEIEDLCERRAMQRSIMQFSTLDWSSVRRAHQQPLEEQSSTAAKILTVKFR
ncbi:leucine-rich repeat-containing protein 72 isoform X1 [Pangasianodon hypophthalmus]|uniref:leucine-rich repeat-containing protein 72 isoform X1 n=2 Tax=Pangasianodon hypophthalmus TaxID=310915 RepID=UPI000EFE7C39|nr:leucine-rich repeat-containing protein 72 isoform X1 [Pangasianodon hypophthalmus]